MRIEAGIVMVLTDDLRIRQRPTTGEILGLLHTGQIATATGNIEAAGGLTWIEIVQQPSNRIGWVAASEEGEAWLANVEDGPIAIMAGADVELVDPDTSARRTLTNGLGVRDGAFSPDGTRFAILEYEHGPVVIPVSEVTTSDSLPAPGPPFAGAQLIAPSFSPDGEWLAFLQSRDGVEGTGFVWLGDAGTIPQMPYVQTHDPLDWAPHSSHYTTSVDFNPSDYDNWEVVVADIGGGVRRITDDTQWTGTPAWAPDGSLIAFGGNTELGELTLEAMGPDGSRRRVVRSLPFATPHRTGDLSWSPDGTWVSLVFDRDEGIAVVNLINPRTGEYRQIEAPGGRCDDLTWSPTGTRLALLCGRNSYAEPQEAFVMDLNGGNVMSFGYATELDWGRSLNPSVR